MKTYEWGFRATQLLSGLIDALIILISLAVVVAVTLLLVRFLWVATKAAQLYIAQNSPPQPPVTETDTAPAPTAPTAPAAPQSAAPAAATTTATTQKAAVKKAAPKASPAAKPTRSQGTSKP